MEQPLRTLVIEESSEDLQPMIGLLRRGGFHVKHTLVTNSVGFRELLRDKSWDLVIAAQNAAGIPGRELVAVVNDLGSRVPVLWLLELDGAKLELQAHYRGESGFILRQEMADLAEVVSDLLRRANESNPAADSCESGEWELDLTGVAEWIRFQGIESTAALRKYFQTYPEDEKEPEMFARVVTANEAAARLLGRKSAADLLGNLAAKWPAGFAGGWTAILEGLVDGIRLVQADCLVEIGPGTMKRCSLSAALPANEADLVRVRVRVRELADQEPRALARFSPRAEPDIRETSLEALPEPPVKVLTPAIKPADMEGPGGGTILLVDDQDAVRNVTRTVLVRNGYTVLEAASGADALLLAQDHMDSIDVMLTDMSMPGMNGAELAKELRLRRPQTKVIYMSGYTPNTAEDGVFLQKPFLQATLLETLRGLMETP